jgi:hypothetical protein
MDTFGSLLYYVVFPIMVGAVVAVVCGIVGPIGFIFLKRRQRRKSQPPVLIAAS